MQRILTFLFAFFSSTVAIYATEPTAEQVRFFETSIRPLLVEQCQKCHGADKQQAGLRLDSQAATLTGGDTGAAIVPGKPEESLLIAAVRQTGDLKMPPKSKLTDRQIADLVKWIEMGAPFAPQAAKRQAQSRDPNHWAFQPPREQVVPVVKNNTWPRSELDRFVLAKLEAAGLSPAPSADKRTLLRRVTFDLIGLPPTPAEIDAFLKDNRPDAFSRIVDRLLESPAYGERWGRHWLDIARYADSNGLDENVAHGNAWRYRDYVVNSFNSDKPFDQFVVEQLAGDLLPARDEPHRHELLIATGFLSLGPKVLAEVDEAKMEMDIVDEQIDTVGRAFLGLTLGCARCHDHKFDPIDAADYYGLAGIFKSTKTMENFKKVAKWHENVLPSPAATQLKLDYDAQVTAKRQATDALAAKTDASESEKAELKKLRDELAQLQKSPPDLPAAMGVAEGTIANTAICLRGNPLKLGAVIDRHVPPVLRGPGEPKFSASESGRRELAQWLVDGNHPLTSRVIVNRVWRWHFGKGLVATTDNFGLLGEAPSHPELLDWLARRFVADGWSLKSLHRRIVNSSTYQQSSNPSTQTVARDPENRLLSRANVRRLEAEAVRDALLFVSGNLDRTMGGPVLTVKNRGYLFDHTSKDLTEYTSRRRSLYLPVIRNNLYDLFQLLDFPDAAITSGDRATTTVAPQALLMLNSDFVMDCAAGLAARVWDKIDSDEQLFYELFATAYGRPPSVAELSANRNYLANLQQSARPEAAGVEPRRQALNALCHTILAANEFIYMK